MVESSFARSRSPGDGPVCPACGKAVDPLRAGHVAILGDEFRYYCDERCKREHVRSLSSPPPSVVVTAEPPAVAPIAPPVSAPRLSAAEEEAALVAAPEPSPAPVPVPTLELAGDEDVERENLSAPNTLRSAAPPTSGLRAAPVGERVPRAWWRDSRARLEALAVAGAIAGVLAPSVALAGDDATPFRFPLAVIATLAVVTRALLEPREVADAHPFVAVVPVVGALLAAAWAQAMDDPHAIGLASFAGFAAAGVLVVNLLLGRAREGIDAARDHIARSLDAPVRVVRGEESSLVDASAVKPGEEVVVEAGEIAGVDAIVLAGDAVVSPWLDSVIEVPKHDGDSIVAGARVLSGRVRATTTWAGADRAWVRLARAESLRIDVAAPLARSARSAVERGAPIAALIMAVVAFAAGSGGPGILAAACAAAIAVGTGGVVGVVALHHARGHLAALAQGIVYKDAASFDRAGRADIAVLCSRGTVLMGEPEIVALEALGSIDVGRVVSLAAGAEMASTHPFAEAILRAARKADVRPDNVRSASVHMGLGVTALASNGDALIVGSRALLLEGRVSVAIAERRVTELEAQGRSVLLVALAGKLVGLLALQDGLRPGARAAVQRLLDARIEPVLLSGETRETCETIGRALDIEHVRPAILPADRGKEVRALGEGGHIVAVLGHPATDDGALGAADVSVALGAAGATPGEWSAALASDDVREAARALAIARDARDRAKVAMWLGVVPGVIALLALVFGVAPLMAAPLAAVLGTVAALVHAKQ